MASDPLSDRPGFSLPVGTVTFLLTDVEGSSRGWEAVPDAMRAAVARHYEVLDGAIVRHRGVRPVEQGEGDSVVGAFARASDALEAALDAQRALQTEAWPPGAELKVRMAVHTGEAELRDEGNYFGPAVVRCARLRAIAHGGQVLISGPSADLVFDRLPPGVSLADLGLHRLKDLGRPERVFQLCHAELAGSFDVLRSLDVLPNNLPVELTTFVGRHAELEELRELVSGTRVLSLTGAGGCGKTRLALQVAADVLDRYGGGAWLVELASVTDPDRVTATIASAMGERDLTGDLIEAIVIRVGSQPTLVVLDNCEHLLVRVAEVVDTLLRRCRELTVLATSREPLGVPGETAWRVPSLTLPVRAEPVPVDSLTQFDAVRLFLDRATKARPNFRLSEENAPAVAQICSRLDGIPLAIELAAARVRGLTAEQLAAGLDDRFRLLTGGARTVLPRQQTLQASVDWGYDLLTEPERAVFRRLALFAGGFTLDAAEQVVAHDGIEPVAVLDLLLALVDKSMVVADQDSGRYRMLETLRQYGAARLVEASETSATRDRHLAWATTLWDPIASVFRLRVHAWPTLDAEIDNLRAAYEWAMLGTEPDLVLRLGAALIGWELWRGDVPRGIDVARQTLDIEGGDPKLRLVVLSGLAHLHYETGDLTERASIVDDLLGQLAGMGNDDEMRCIALRSAAFVEMGSDFARAIELGTAAVEAAERTGDDEAIAVTKSLVVSLQLFSGVGPEPDDATRALGERAAPEAWRLNVGLALARRALDQGRFDDARTHLDSLGGTPAEGPRIALTWEATRLEVDLAQGVDTGTQATVAVQLDQARRRGFTNGVAYGGWAPGVWALTHGDVETGAAEVIAWRDETLRVRPIHAMYAHFAVSALLAAGRVDDARQQVEASKRGSDALGVPPRMATLTSSEGVVMRAAGDLVDAERLQREALTVLHDHQWRPQLTHTLEALAGIAAANESPVECTRLAGAASALRDRIGYVLRFPYEQQLLTADLSAARAALGDDAFDTAFAEGRALDDDAALAYATRARGERPRRTIGWESLTPTEQEVLNLTAEGLSNKEIGGRLLMSPETVKTHLSHIYDKTGVRTRTALAREATLRATDRSSATEHQQDTGRVSGT